MYLHGGTLNQRDRPVQSQRSQRQRRRDRADNSRGVAGPIDVRFVTGTGPCSTPWSIARLALGVLARDESADVDDPLHPSCPKYVPSHQDWWCWADPRSRRTRRRWNRRGAAHASPGAPVSSTDLIAYFLARSTMFWIIAPELKSLKNRTSLSPLAYVTSRKRFSSLSAYMRSTTRTIIAFKHAVRSPPNSARSSALIGRPSTRYFEKMS